MTDDITPSELKQLYTDPALSLQRYDEAVAQGLEESLPQEGHSQSRDGLQFYYNPELTPELEPMWLAFRTFYDTHLDRSLQGDDYVDAVPERLREFGVSAAGANTILTAARATETEVEQLMADLGPKQEAMGLLIEEVYSDPARAASAPPKKQFYNAVLGRDYKTVSSVVGRPESEIRELVDSHADWGASYELIADSLPVLKGRLSDADWQGFRGYLLKVVAAGKGSYAEFDAFYGEASQ